ncbi:thiamine ABC transporter substrate-binding protein [Leucobacter sp. cx-328]|uniref:thiamine ABC transporter substrate-binding protein n=1 Tax=unclassified Leucobacter TaxID=2621730 RepID=UPI00165DE0AB|nr:MULTISPECIES: thiamine ABC transporter substrate-binding protein [unclassified Leucobacter]MBC9943297.1 thiamine ABC transporter substrate-binding protein [Leucobacter sp. cx-328]
MRAYNPIVRRSLTASVAALALISLSACSSAPEAKSNDVTIIVHDSFVDGPEFEAAASAATGYDVKVVTAGDGGELTNKLVLTKNAPIADAFFGVDNTFASRLVENEVVDAYEPQDMPASAIQHALATDGAPAGNADRQFAMVGIDRGATCMNIDPAWFAEKQLAEPVTFEDLAKPEYQGLTVLIDPLSSSTGASFLASTVAAFGEDGYNAYWQSLVDNDARVAQGWDEAYYGQFTQGGEGTYPIVLSYSSSPAWTVTEDGKATTTKALLETCSTQVEYAGVLNGAANKEGAEAVVDYLLSFEFQQQIPDAMYMYPVDEAVEMPEAWASFAPMPTAEQSHDLLPAEIEAGRETWLKQISATLGL